MNRVVMNNFNRRRPACHTLALFAVLVFLSTSDAENMTHLPDDQNSDAVDDTPAFLIIMFGDSLTAGLNVPGENSFPAIVEKKLMKLGYSVRVVNAGVSGDTTSGGLGRLDSLIADRPDIVVLELGVNDGLRGVPLDLIENNLEKIIKRLLGEKVTVILAGMKLPPNYGSLYVNGFQSIFLRLASKYRLNFIPFLLEGVAGNPELNQFDGIHPTGEGYEIVSNTVLPELLKVMKVK